MRSSTWKRRLVRPGDITLALLVGAAMSSCTVGPDHESPDVAELLEANWRQAPGSGLVEDERTELVGWWRRFGSAELDALATRLLQQNLSLREAAERVVAVRANVGATDAQRSPRLDGEGSAFRAGTGDESLNFQGPPPGTDVSVYSLGVAAGWELDLWGRVARLVENARAEVAIAEEDFRGVAVTLLAELAIAYVDATSLQHRLEIARRELATRERTLELTRSRLDAGTGTRVEWLAAQRELAAARARLPELEQARRLAENRIALLVGERPRDGLVVAAGELTLPEQVSRGVPADLLAHRTDVRGAERRLAAAVARIGAVEAERYPRIALNGSLALRTSEFDELFAGRSAVSYSIGPSLTVPLFDGARITSEVHFREARAREARIAFERTVLAAIGEVEAAATSLVKSRERLAQTEQAAAAAAEAARLERQLYEAGSVSLMLALDAERARLALDDASWSSRQAALVSTIDLYRALGGGFESAPPPAITDSSALER
ncbi:MAG: efflux transporter outer membrane subunit [Planctomycetes bacterium]|nr:efflux transporter outer membrane subunit [Planctomycetota bacterium]